MHFVSSVPQLLSETDHALGQSAYMMEENDLGHPRILQRQRRPVGRATRALTSRPARACSIRRLRC